MAAVQVNLSGPRKAAILILTLGEEASSEVLKHLQEEEIERIAKELASMGGVPAETGEKILDEFNSKASANQYMSRGGVDYARRLLDRSFGPSESKRILDRVGTQFRAKVGFTTLERA